MGERSKRSRGVISRRKDTTDCYLALQAPPLATHPLLQKKKLINPLCRLPAKILILKYFFIFHYEFK